MSEMQSLFACISIHQRRNVFPEANDTRRPTLRLCRWIPKVTQMPLFNICVRRVVRRVHRRAEPHAEGADTIITVEAPDFEAARSAAEIEATSVPQEHWDTYDCEYWSEASDGPAS
jgi:hypothetical protein